MKFLIFDREENYIGNLKDVLEAKQTEEINGEDVLSIATLDKSIGKGYKLVYKDKYGSWKEFIVKEIEESHTSDGIEKKLFCESSFYETFGDYIEDKRPSGTANHALSVALEPTRWEVGQVDNLGINSTNFNHISAKEAVQKVAETWQGEIRTRVAIAGNKITARYVDLFAKRGQDLGKRFTYTKDLESITRIIHRDDVITALYGYGKGEEIVDEEGNPTGGFGRRIDFSEINNGKSYVENNDARLIWGRNNQDGTKSHVFGKVEFDDCDDKQELLQRTTEKLEEISSPLITYEAKAIDLGGADLGDDVAVIDKEFTPALRLKARVIKMVRDLLEEENNSLVLGNFIPSIVDNWNKQEEFINNFRSKTGVWDRAKIIDSDGTINAQFLNNLVDELNQKMNSQGGYVYVSDDGKGLITYDKPVDQDPTMAIQILGGAFRIANNKLPNGEWEWRSFGTGAGFTADELIAGILRGGKVQFDLTNGTFLIGNSIDDYNFYFDGASLKIRLSSGNTIEESISQAQSNAEANAKAYVNPLLDELQEQIDGSITTWFYDYEPTNSNIPASNWTTTELKNIHLGDLFYDTITGYCYRWKVSNNVYSWQRITDTDVTKALEDASKAQATADGKMKVFVTQPTNADDYQIGDLWIRDGEVWTCKTAKIADAAFNLSHWGKKLKYTDDTVANANLAEAKSYAETKAIEAENASKAYAEAKAEAERILAESYADGIVSAEEQARIDDVEAKLELAKTHAEEQDILAKKAAQEYADLVAKGSSMIDKDYQSGVSLMSEKADDSVVHADMDGESFQDGEPSPDNPIEIKSVGTYNLDTTKYEFDVVSHGKNLCGYNDSLPVTKNGVLFSYKDGVYTVKGATAAGAYPYHAIFTIKANTLSDGVYYLKRNNIHNSGTTLAGIRIIDRTTTPYPFNVSGDIPFTITGGHNDLLVEIACTQNAVYDCSFNIQIERGNVFTGYTPFQGINKIAISLDEPLRKIGDVADRVFRDSDELWKVERVTAETTFTGQSVILENAKENGMYFCTHKQSGNLDGKTLTLEESVDDLVTVIYELASPTITALPDEMQISLNNLQTYEGTNYVYTVGTEIEPTLHGTFKSEAWYRNYQLQNKMQNTIDELADAQDSLDNLSDTVIPALEDNLISESEKKAIKASLKQFESEKADLDAQYNVIYNNSNLTGTAKSDLQTAKTTYNSRFSALNTAVNNILTATGTVSQSLIDVYETAYLSYKTSLGNLSEKLQEAVRSIEDKIKSDGENYADSAVDGLEIGGRNLLLNTDFSIGSEPWKAQGHVISVDNDVTYDDRNSLKVISTSDGILSSNRFYAFIPTTTKVYGEVTVSFYAKGETSNQVQARTSSTVFTFELTTDWKRFYFTAPKTGTNDRVVMCLVNAGTAWFNGFKFEKGNKATDWSPAPEDIYTKTEVDAEILVLEDEIALKANQTEVNAVSTRVTDVESKVTTEAIVQTVRQSTEYIDDLAGKADESTVSQLAIRVHSAELKITPEAITQTVTESQTYKDDLKGIDDKITNPNLLPLGWVDKTSNTAETLYEETVHLEKGDYWLIVDYTTIVGNQGQLLANGTLVSVLTGAIYSAKWTQATSGNVTFKIINLYGFEFHLNFVKLEQGDKYTGFMADDGDLKYQSEYISTVEQTASKIAWIVKSGTSASNMVLTDEMYSVIASNIELTADNIKLEGYTTINNAFQIDGYGNVKMFSGIIDINAQTWLSPTNYNFRIYDPSLLTYVMANHKTLEVGDGHYVDSFVRLTTDGSTPKIEVGTDTVLTDYRLTVSAITMNSKVLYLDNGYVKYTP